MMTSKGILSGFCAILGLALCGQAAGTTVSNETVGFVYQLQDEGSFDFHVPGLFSDCGSDMYRVRESNIHVLNRKFALVLSAFLADRRITFTFDDIGSCESDRKVIRWVRIVP